MPEVKVYLNESTTPLCTLNSKTTFANIDIAKDFKKLKSGANYLVFKTSDSGGLARASFTLFWGGYFNYS